MQSIKDLSTERKIYGRVRGQEAVGRGQGEPCKVEPFQAEYPLKDLSPEPEPPQQSRRRLLVKGEREHLPLRSEDQGDGLDHW